MSDSIDEQIRLDKQRLRTEKDIVKVLLLGQSESGKSTTLKRTPVFVLHLLHFLIQKSKQSSSCCTVRPHSIRSASHGVPSSTSTSSAPSAVSSKLLFPPHLRIPPLQKIQHHSSTLNRRRPPRGPTGALNSTPANSLRSSPSSRGLSDSLPSQMKTMTP